MTIITPSNQTMINPLTPSIRKIIPAKELKQTPIRIHRRLQYLKEVITIVWRGQIHPVSQIGNFQIWK